MAEPMRLLAVVALFSLKLSALERQSVSGHQPCHSHILEPVSSRKRAERMEHWEINSQNLSSIILMLCIR